MAKAEVLPLSAADIPEILPIIRQADRDEIEGALQIDLASAISDGLGDCCKASKIVVGDKVVAIFGDSKHDATTGIPWLISTVYVERHPKAFLQVCKPEVAEMLTRHDSLFNFVDVRNTVAIRWLAWLGFTFGDPVGYGPLGMPFKPFCMTRSA